MLDQAAAEMNILVLCTGNSCRSQMAEGFLRHLVGDKAQVFSAGVEAHGLNPLAVAAMAEVGVDISHHSSKLVGQFLGTGITHVITVCDHAAEMCPYFPEQVEFTHYNFPDPAKATGSAEEVNAVFAQVREMIQACMREWWDTVKG